MEREDKESMPNFLRKFLGALLLISTSGYVSFIALF